MWAIIGILFIGVIITLFVIPSLVKKKWWREIIVYFLFLSVGITLSILLIIDVKIPTPLDWIAKIYSPVTLFFERVLS